MNALLAGIAVFVVFLLALQRLETQRRSQYRHRRRNGLKAVEESIALMTVIQQHRGLSAALLNGDKSFAAKVQAKQAEIHAAYKTLSDHVTNTPALYSSRTDMEAIDAEWGELRAKVHNLDPTQSYIMHTDLVRHVLYFINDIGERSGLLENRNRYLVKLTDTLLLRLPVLVETVGQARAMGTGFAAKGKCGAVGRIRLTFLSRRIHDCLSNIDPALKDISQDSRDKVEALLELLSSRIIGVEHIDIAPDKYFQISTEAIDSCLLLWRKAAAMADAQL